VSRGSCGESAIGAPPADGRANAAVDGFLAELLGKARSDVAVVRGASSRVKVVLARGPGLAETRKILSTHLR
jgi:uncharacterized protein YggU (UPF0235/DUF167 family)